MLVGQESEHSLVESSALGPTDYNEGVMWSAFLLGASGPLPSFYGYWKNSDV